MSRACRTLFAAPAVARSLAVVATAALLTCAAWAEPGGAAAEPSEPALRALRPRQPAGPPSLYELPPETPVGRIVVKFHEGASACEAASC